MLYRSRASVAGSMPHSYGSSFTWLYFSEWIRLEGTRVNSARPVATTKNMAIGMYAESIWMNDRAKRRAMAEKPLVYNMHSTRVSTYTGLMKRCMLAVVSVLAAVVLARP